VAVPEGLLLEDQPDRGDLYTFEPAGEAARRPATGITAERLGDEPLTRLQVDFLNETPDHRLRLLVPADTRGGAWAGVAFGAVQRPFRAPGTEPGWEYDLRTDPAREWVVAGGVGVILPGPFEYELLEGYIALTLLRSTGWLSRGDLSNRPGNAGPEIATPGGQMLGPQHFELALFPGAGDHLEVARWADVYCHPLALAPAGLADPPTLSGRQSEFVSALRRVGGRAQLRTYDLADFRIRERWLD
jgi:alpha-mannosidase